MRNKNCGGYSRSFSNKAARELLFVLLNMEKGVKMTRLAPGAVHMFGEPGMAERIVSAWKHGTEVTLDLVSEWDCWNDMALPLAEVRRRYNIAAGEA